MGDELVPRRADAAQRVLREAFTIVLAGVMVGILGAMATSRLLKGLLYRLSPMDPPMLIAASIALFGFAALAAYVPARRASRVDPMIALRLTKSLK
jgi:ABC-type antimicrobial peptide transport system permease subunit